MREILFRAWHKDLNEMFYKVRVSDCDWCTYDTHFCGRHDTLMQFTGLLDKNGKEVYEGDVVNVFGKYSNDQTCVVEYQECEMCFGFTTQDGSYMIMDEIYNDERFGIEVIGNIYENPELLKG
jgi:uncharacterized phage protein (TIGR01671 family)